MIVAHIFRTIIMKRSFFSSKQALSWQLARIYLLPPSISSFKLLPPKKPKFLPTNTETDKANLLVTDSSTYRYELARFQKESKNKTMNTIEGVHNTGLLTVYSHNKASLSAFKSLLKAPESDKCEYQLRILILPGDGSKLVYVRDIGLLLAYDRFCNMEMVEYIRTRYMSEVVVYKGN